MIRQRKPWTIVSFNTTAAAFQMEDIAKKQGVSGRLIPVPREITAGCGLAWKSEPQYEAIIREVIEQNEIEYGQIITLNI